jgi:hypothetical protein
VLHSDNGVTIEQIADLVATATSTHGRPTGTSSSP